ncbi:hypothetical protein AVEN_93592-1 [Araneus ventricosus]|uniref:Uncharacterized protein n=1 Tax=Araneus ventricosus TaxID=182803 RepID=A0A4Y2VTB6_ARAVE|nr:hypothetical protein AVEN_93592-1 [Araneus ventricosus]
MPLQECNGSCDKTTNKPTPNNAKARNICKNIDRYAVADPTCRSYISITSISQPLLLSLAHKIPSKIFTCQMALNCQSIASNESLLKNLRRLLGSQ